MKLELALSSEQFSPADGSVGGKRSPADGSVGGKHSPADGSVGGK